MVVVDDDGVAGVPRRHRVGRGARLPGDRRLAAEPAPRAGRRGRDRGRRPGAGPGRAPGLTGRRASAAPGLGLDLDEQARVDQRADLDQRGRRPDLAEDLAVDREDLGGTRDVGRRTSGSGRRRRARSRPRQAALDDLEDRPRLGRRRRPGWRDRPSGPASVVPGDPARVADDDRPAVAGDAPPTARPTRSAGARLTRDRGGVGPPRQARTSGSRAIASSRPASSVVRGTIESTSRYSAGRVVVAADRPEAVEARDAHARRRVRVGRAAGRRVVDLEAEALRRPPGRARRAGRSARASPSATSAPSRSKSTVVSGTSVALGDLADRRLGRLEVRSRSSPGRRPRASQRSATTLGRVPPAITPTLTVTPGQRPLSACRSRDDPAPPRGSRCGPSRARRRRGRPGRGPSSRRSRMPLRAETMSPFARAHSRTRHASTSAASAADVRRRGRRADLLVRVGDERQPLERQAAELADERLERVEPGEQPRLHVGDARAVGDARRRSRNGRCGRGPRVEDRVHVADEQDARRRRRGPSNVADDRVAEAAGRIRPELDRRRRGRSGTRPIQRPTSLTPSGV